MSYWKREIRTLEALGIKKESIDEAQENGQPFKDMLFSSKIIASSRGMTSEEIATAEKLSYYPEEEPSDYDKEMIEAAKDNDGN